ncbi:RNA exonuclease 1 homolog [Maniola hyperantus]|uniref:RNA exonuclease 1 homolog n=1 Tax=Aphantopus hyperantus TaxID=2795564 RepID=UPI00156A6550|nr:RNA exonuclease 1 homolog [Maniola hyperantus]
MLPSTGYFKGINCPFYDSGLCERPYCHFRHAKKEPQNIGNDAMDSGAILQKLVSAAVQKVLQQTETGTSSPSQNVSDSEKNSGQSVSPKVTYNPTPIAELNKINNTDSENTDDSNEQKRRHIPVPYTPRKPASIPIKRPVDTNGSKLFTYLPPAQYNPGSETAQLDPYTPKGATESGEKYLPGSEKTIPEYKPKETQNSTVNYIPSDKAISKKKILEYKPAKVKSMPSSVTYQPTPRSLVPCFSSDEDEPDNKKRKFSSDLNGLDDLGPEFDILDQILDEEKAEKEVKSIFQNNIDKESTEKLQNQKCASNSNVSAKSDTNKSEKERSSKTIDKKSNDKSTERTEKSSNNSTERKQRSKDKSVERKEKSSDKSTDRKEKSYDKSTERKEKSYVKSTERQEKSSDKDKQDRKSSDRKSSHKSSSKVINKYEKTNKSEEKSHTNSKHSKSNSSKHSKQTNDIGKHKDSQHSKSHRRSKESKDKHKEKHKKSASKTLSDDDSHNYEDNLEDELNELSESDEESIALQCKKIFEEYVPTEKSQNTEECHEKLEAELDIEEYLPTKKRISRTIDKNIKILPKAPIKPDFKVNAAQAMAERLAKVREFHGLKSTSESNNSTNLVSIPESTKPVFCTPPPSASSSKIRIAHVPYASTMLSAKKVIAPSTIITAKKNDPSSSCTITQTVKKGTQRVAHMPSEKFIDRPGVLEPLGSKIAANIRSTYLNMMIDHCLKIYLSPTDAYARAQHEELATSKKCSTVQIYKNSAVLAISRLKKEVLECNGVKKSGSDCAALSKVPQGAVGKSNVVGSWSIESKIRRNFEDPQQFTGAKFYNNIQKWILTEDQLKENGFPRPHSSGVKGRAIIYGQNKQTPPKGYIRTCRRCKKNYTVDKKGFPTFEEECIYHPNNKYRVRGEVRYQCCSQEGSSDGCCIASSHVYEYVDFENLKGYVKTLPPDCVMEDYGVYSLDCEMCYTTQGLDLTRVTVINTACKVVYETLIKPLHPIIDYNTRYSGITEEQMSEVKTTLLDVQATLLNMFNSKTILIGHSLESDFKALKLIHDTVIDTSVLYPHKMGPPYKRALRNLSSEYLKKIIQNSVDGHDSAEDATVCMELLIYKVKEDLKTR